MKYKVGDRFKNRYNQRVYQIISIRSCSKYPYFVKTIEGADDSGDVGDSWLDSQEKVKSKTHNHHLTTIFA